MHSDAGKSRNTEVTLVSTHKLALDLEDVPIVTLPCCLQNDPSQSWNMHCLAYFAYRQEIVDVKTAATAQQERTEIIPRK
jgi:hypothetical protein